MDTYIFYMWQTIGIASNLQICSNRIVTLLQMYFANVLTEKGEKVDPAVTIDLEADEDTTKMSSQKVHKGKKCSKADLHKRMKIAKSRDDDELFTAVIPDFCKKSKIATPFVEMECLLVSICDGSHWYLLQIFEKDGYGQLLNSDVHSKLAPNTTKSIERWWLCDNLRQGIKTKKLSFPSFMDILQQENPHECVVFVLKYIECIMLGKEFYFTGREITDFCRTIFKNFLNYPGAERLWQSW